MQHWARELGFQQVGITDIDLGKDSERLKKWLDKSYHGSMTWLAENFEKRTDPSKLHPGTARVISFRMNYLPGDTQQIKILKDPNKAYVSRYALGRDYHKLIRKRLAKICTQLENAAKKMVSTSQRPFVDSAPVMERPLAQKAGLGWVGKHTLVINQEAGSWFFLGEIYTNIPLPINQTTPENRCGDCTACLKVCPTDAFTRPYELDARRCISYLTIENKGSIPEEFREPIGNRVFGCDDCQAICPWNKFAQHSGEDDFSPRHQLDNADLLNLFDWSEETFLKNTEGSAIRRIGYEGWLRNLAVGLGNAPSSDEVMRKLIQKRSEVSPLVAEHIDWALARQQIPSAMRKRKIKNSNKHEI